MQSDRREGGATRRLPIPVVDIFAGAGGLGEGFAACRTGARPAFRVALSIEKDPAACETLELRHFFRAFPADAVPDEYYLCLRGRMTRDELFRRFPRQRAAAQRETWQAALGPDDGFEERLDDRIEQVIGGRRDWVLIGGPPCQAYSIAGRTKNRSKSTYVPEQDRRHFLYEEYLRIISRHWPAVFVMENVKGILTSRLGGVPIFGRILDDLSDPARAFGHRRRQHEDRYRYRLFPLEARGSVSSRDLFGIEMSRAEDFLVRSELHGVPQARHRVFVLGVRDDLPVEPGHIAISGEGEVPASAVLDGLPRLRSGLSGNRDSRDAWRGWLASIPSTRWYAELRELGQDDVRVLIDRTLAKLTVPREDRGAEFVAHSRKISHSARYRQLLDFVRDPRVGGFCNSATREHMPEDLHRYLFAACFARARLCSPKLRDFPESLLPEHQNVLRAMRNDLFADRFRVQLRSAPATTVMSHIAKDGHYFIHPDASQCRSLTVREAARLQTFPDNYAFCGPRTEQYVQVGNAVPPFLAVQIADVVAKLLEAERRGHRRGGAGAGHRGPRTDFPKAARPA